MCLLTRSLGVWGLVGEGYLVLGFFLGFGFGFVWDFFFCLLCLGVFLWLLFFTEQN